MKDWIMECVVPTREFFKDCFLIRLFLVLVIGPGFLSSLICTLLSFLVGLPQDTHLRNQAPTKYSFVKRMCPHFSRPSLNEYCSKNVDSLQYGIPTWNVTTRLLEHGNYANVESLKLQMHPTQVYIFPTYCVLPIQKKHPVSIHLQLLSVIKSQNEGVETLAISIVLF